MRHYLFTIYSSMNPQAQKIGSGHSPMQASLAPQGRAPLNGAMSWSQTAICRDHDRIARRQWSVISARDRLFSALK